ncbi:MAG: T9SS type A sorting domain-containing protein, partial [Chitinophagales bacterium]|nr:T9SS type A sorting domain-containing protein [Chitinophagales bacterium]
AKMMIDYMQMYYGIDPSKVYSTGYSAGGFMSYRLACDMPGRLAAIAPVASSMITEIYESCNPEKRIPVMIVNGTADPVVAYQGIPGNFPSVDKVVEFWSKESVCDPVIIPDTLPNIQVNDNSRVVKIWYPPCTDTKGVLFYKILYGGHTWPGSGPLSIVGNTNQDVKINDEMWNFFSQYQIASGDFCASVVNPAVNVADCTAALTWDAVPDAASYRIVVHNLQTREFLSYTSNTNTFSLPMIAGSEYRWSVGVDCGGGTFRSTNGPDFYACPGISGKVAKIDEKFLLYPNPASSFIQVLLEEDLEITVASLLDYSGKIIKEINLSPGLNEINIEDLAEGMYILQTSQGNQAFVKI